MARVSEFAITAFKPFNRMMKPALFHQGTKLIGILIKEPYEYEVFYKDQVNVNLICSAGNFKVKLANRDNPLFIPVTANITSGVLLNKQVTLT